MITLLGSSSLCHLHSTSTFLTFSLSYVSPSLCPLSDILQLISSSLSLSLSLSLPLLSSLSLSSALPLCCSPDNGEHGVEVLALAAVQRDLDEVLDDLHALELVGL